MSAFTLKNHREAPRQFSFYIVIKYGGEGGLLYLVL